MRMTRQRRVILEELRAAAEHPSADELYQRVRRRLPRVSLATVYRNLELLCERGSARRLDWSGGQMRFDGKTHPHYHIRCVRCGRVEDAAVQPMDDLEARLAGKTDYRVLGHRLEFVGLCGACRRHAGQRRSQRAT